MVESTAEYQSPEILLQNAGIFYVYGRHHDLVDPYNLAVSKLISDLMDQSKHGKLANTGFSFSLTSSTDTLIWRVYYNKHVMLTTCEQLIIPLSRGPCLCITYFETVNA